MTTSQSILHTSLRHKVLDKGELFKDPEKILQDKTESKFYC